MTSRRRRALTLLLTGWVVLLSSCRPWEHHPDVRFADMKAAADLYLRATFDRGYRWQQEDQVHSVQRFVDTDWFAFFVLALVTACMVLPFEQSYEVAIRPDGAGGSELSVRVDSHWQLLAAVPVWFRDHRLEDEIRRGIAANLGVREEHQAAAGDAVRRLLAALRAGDEAGFLRCTWERAGDRDAREAWFDDPWFWSAAERGRTEDAVDVSWPPHVRTYVARSFFGLGLPKDTPCDAVFVTVRHGERRRRLEVVKDGSGWFVVMPLTPDGQLARD